MLEFDGPCFELFALTAHLPHAADPNSHIKLENGLLLLRNCGLFLGAFVEPGALILVDREADGEELLCLDLFLRVAFDQVLDDVPDYVYFCVDASSSVMLFGCHFMFGW